MDKTEEISCKEAFWFNNWKQKKLSTVKEEPTNIYELYDPSHGRRSPPRLQKSFSNQAQEWINPNKYFSEDDLMHTTQDPVGDAL